jgi:hypothetical protein
MDINTLAAWGEFLGGIAVVASLIYLASQIRQNSRLLEAAAEDSRIGMYTSTSAMMVSDPEVARIFWDGVEDRAALSEEDRRRFDPLMSMMYQGFAQQWEHQRTGHASATGWELQERGMRWQSSRAGARHWWAQYRELYAPGFQAYVDSLMRDGESESGV